MKKVIAVLTLVLACAVYSNAQNNVPKPTNDSIVYKGVTDPACALEIQFGSYSAGIDAKTYDKIIALIDSKKLKYTSKNIGREGETRLCLPLTELSKRKRNKFIEQLKKIARQGYLTSISIR